jgi:crotonobetainyl-CoA:carnitine CoA-transferase CaiB-like acyl-CoA transferase
MAALVLQNNSMIRVTAVDGPVHAGLLDRLRQLRSAGAPYGRQAAVLPESPIMPAMRRVYYRTFRTKDAAIASVSPGLQRALMRALGLADEAHERPIAGAMAQGRHYQALGDRVEAVIASRTTAEWKAIFDTHGVPASGVKLPIELLDDEQTLANQMLPDVLIRPSVPRGFCPLRSTWTARASVRPPLPSPSRRRPERSSAVWDSPTRTSMH